MKLKGSYTIELALIMPLVIGLIYGVICLSFLGYDRVAIRGMIYQSMIREEQQELPVLLAHKDVAIQWQESEQDAEIICRAETGFFILRMTGAGNARFRTEMEGVCRKRNPIRFIRKCRIAERVWEGVQER